MSSLVYPSLPGIAMEVQREQYYKTKVWENPGGTEQRVSFYSLPRYRWDLKYPFLRQYAAAPAPYAHMSEASAVLGFLNSHLGAWDSFLFNDPLADVNLLLRSEDLSHTAWVKTTGCQVSADTGPTAPDGTATADAIAYLGTGSAGDVRIYQLGPTSEVGVVYTASVWLTVNPTYPMRLMDGFGNEVAVSPDATWRRYSLTGVGNGNAVALKIASPAGSNAFFGVNAWGAQIEPVHKRPGTYVATTTAAVTGQVRVRFDEDSLRLNRIGDQIFEASFSLHSVLST